jgi:hypothetical protein
MRANEHGIFEPLDANLKIFHRVELIEPIPRAKSFAFDDSCFNFPQ